MLLALFQLPMFRAHDAITATLPEGTPLLPVRQGGQCLIHVEVAVHSSARMARGLPTSVRSAKTKTRPGSDGVHFQERLTVSGSITEEVVSKSILSSRWVAALAGGAMLALELSPASAFTLSGPSVRPVTSEEFDKVYYRGYHGVYTGRYHRVYHGGYAYHGGYGYHPYGYGEGVVVRHVLHTPDQPTRDLQWLWNDP
jgi:hypothetical protein